MKKHTENYILETIAEFFNKKNKKTLEELEKLVNSLWETRKQIKKDIISYNMLHALHFYFNKIEVFGRNRWVKIPCSTKDVSFNFETLEISILSFDSYKNVTIKIEEKKEISNELYDFICKFFNFDIKLNLKNLDEKYKIEEADLSGI